LINEDLQKLRQDSQYTGSTVLNDDSKMTAGLKTLMLALANQSAITEESYGTKQARQCKDHYTSGTERRKTKT